MEQFDLKGFLSFFPMELVPDDDFEMWSAVNNVLKRLCKIQEVLT